VPRNKKCYTFYLDIHIADAIKKKAKRLPSESKLVRAVFREGWKALKKMDKEEFAEALRE